MVPLAAFPKPPPNRPDGFVASAAGLLWPLPPKGVKEVPAVAPPPPNRPPGLLAAGVFDAPPPKIFDVPAFDPPPNKPAPAAGVLVPALEVLAVPKMLGADPPEVLAAPPNKGLFGVAPLFACPNVKPDIMRG